MALAETMDATLVLETNRPLMRDRLREATAAAHRRVEEHVDLLNPNLTVDAYRNILCAFYGYYEPLERRVAAAALLAPLRDFDLIDRTARIERDLLTLGASRSELEALARCPDIPNIVRPADVAGILYVIEGASLGGQVIGRALARKFGISARNGASFFVGEGPRTAIRWKNVLRWIDDVASTEYDASAVVDAACATFETIAAWFERQVRHV